MKGMFVGRVSCTLLIWLSSCLQSAFIPEDVYHRIHVCLKSLVTLPLPYCAIAMHYARQIKMEQTTPGNVQRNI